MATTIYSVAAVLGGTVLLCQFVMTLLGMGDHDLSGDVGADVPHDFHFGLDGNAHDGGIHESGGHDTVQHDSDGHQTHQHDSSWFFRMITFRTVVAALTFFGLSGLAAEAAEFPGELSLVIALAAGGGAMYGVHSLLQAMHKLKADGTVRIERSVGRSGTVYLRVPAQKSGVGKVQINVQNRTMEYEAMTSGDELPVGSRVVVAQILGPETVEVDAVLEPERISHV